MDIAESKNVIIYRMGSFFYGNPFGKNTCLYALVASNQSTNISFENSTFNK